MRSENSIKNVSYANLGERTTCCVLTMDNSFEITGVFTCKADMIIDKEFREQGAYNAAIKNLERREEKRKQKFDG